MNKFYTMRHKSANRTPYAPTIISNNPVYFSHCPKCGKSRYNHSNKDLSLIVEGKGKLPDYLQCGHYPLCIVSDRVIEVWDAAKITGYESSPVKLIDAQKEEINQGLQYHNITVTNTVELDFEKMGVEIVNTCDVCGGNDYNKPVWEFGKAVLKDEHLIEFDLFVCRFFKMSIHCSVKMLEEVYKNKLTNFKFYEYEARFLLSTPVPDIDLNKLFSKRKNSLPDTAK